MKTKRRIINIIAAFVLLLASPAWVYADSFCDVADAHPEPPIRSKDKDAHHAPPIRKVDAACEAMSKLAAAQFFGIKGGEGLLGKRDEWICYSDVCQTTCEAFQKRGQMKKCVAKTRHVSPEQLAEQAMEKLGCKNLLGRAGEPQCSNEAGKSACEALHAEGLLKQCH